MNTIDPKILEKAKQWLSPGFDEETREQVKHMIDSDPEGLVEAFYRSLEFGTGGMRGIMGPGTNRMNIYVIGMATQGLCNYVKKMYPGRTDLRMAVAHDSRNNSRLFAETTANVISANGIRVFLFDSLRPTPELSFAIRHLGCQSGVVVTASHNPKEYNGYKVYWEDGGQVVAPHDSDIITEVEKISSIGEVLFTGNPALIQPIGREVDEAYLDSLSTLSLNPSAVKRHSDIRIVYTPIHGSGVRLVPALLERFGFTNIIHVPEQDVSDGNFPTVVSPNPEEKAALTMAIGKAVETGAELVMASDPDADRVGIAVRDHDGSFRLLNGNQTGSLLVYYLIRNWSESGRLTGNEFIVRTVVTTPLFAEIAAAYGVRTYEVLTGFKFIAQLIREKEGREVFIGGGEESYGFMTGSFVRDKDAVSSCAMIAEAAAWAKDRGMSLIDILEEIYLKFGFFKEHLISIVRKGKSGLEQIEAMMERFRNTPPQTLGGSNVVMMHDFLKGKSYDLISDLRHDITLPKSNVLQYVTENGSIISVRPSGTEPKIKFYFSVRAKISDLSEIREVDDFLGRRIQSLIADMDLDKD